MFFNKQGDQGVNIDEMLSFFKFYSECYQFFTDNVKALYRRAKAHTGAWNPDDAITDFKRVAELDSSLTGTVQKEVQLIEEQKRQKDRDDRAKLQGKMFG